MNLNEIGFHLMWILLLNLWFSIVHISPINWNSRLCP